MRMLSYARQDQVWLLWVTIEGLVPLRQEEMPAESRLWWDPVLSRSPQQSDVPREDHQPQTESPGKRGRVSNILDKTIV